MRLVSISALAFAFVTACHSTPKDVPASAPDGATSPPTSAADGASSASVVRPMDIFASPASFVNKTIVVDVVEPLRKQSSLDLARDGLAAELEVQVPDGQGNRLVLVPAGYRQGDAVYNNKNTFDHKLRSPIRITGQLLSDPARATAEDAPGFYELRVTGETTIAEGAPKPLDLAQAKAHPADWDRQYVVYQGILTEQFENVSIDGDIWYGEAPDVQKNGLVAAGPVRVTGYFYSHPGRRYGHMGMRPFELVASRVEAVAASPDAGSDAGK